MAGAEELIRREERGYFLWRLAASALAGLLIAASFPPLRLYGLAWIGLVPFLWAVITSRSARDAALFGFAYGYLLTLGTIWWLSEFGGFPPLVIGVLVGYAFAFYGVVMRNLIRRGPWLFMLGGALLYTAIETLDQFGFWSIPLMLMAQTQTSFLPILQLADLTGQWGITFLVLLVNLGIAYYLWGARNHDELLIALVFPAVVFLSVLTYGVSQMRSFSFYSSSRPIYGERAVVAIVQNGGGELVKWTPDYAKRVLRGYLSFVRKKLTEQDVVDLIVFPEATILFALPKDRPAPYIPSGLFDLASDYGASLLFGTTLLDRPVEEEGYRFGGEEGIANYNGAQLISPYRMALANYGKNRPVPFGETQPLGPALKFINFPWGEQGYDSWRRHNALPTQKMGITLGVAICFENLYPEIARGQVLDGATVLIDISNFQWFRNQVASKINAAVDRLRAVEFRRFYLRASTVGYSQVISPAGEVIWRSPHAYGSFLRTQVVEANEKLTLYARLGDWFAYLAIAVSLLIIIKLVLSGAKERGIELKLINFSRLFS